MPNDSGRLLQALGEYQPATIKHLSDNLGWRVQKVIRLLGQLEGNGYVQQRPGGVWTVVQPS